MPVDKVPNGIICLKVKGLSPDGGINPHSESYGLVVLIRKGVGIETEMFRLHGEMIRERFIDQL